MNTAARRVVLIHWKAEEAAVRAKTLRDAGYVVASRPVGGTSLRETRTDPPHAFVIDLSRLPSQGRDVAMVLRSTKATRHVPIVFVGGEPEKVARAREQLPDAVFTDWKRIRGSLRRVIANPVASPVVPSSNLAGYSGTPLPKKLGIKPGTTTALLGAPDDFEKTLGSLPEGATLTRMTTRKSDLSIWFVRSNADLRRGLAKVAPRAATGPVWIAWPKKAAKPDGDVSERKVRARGLAAGLVDYKVCSIDATWSGLLFTRKRR